jgi:hypothetical protein
MRIPATHTFLSRALPALAVALVVAGCARRRVVVVAPALDANQTALALEDYTSLEEPLRIIFDWELNEQGVRVDGRGVARIEPPYKARIDLFLGSEPILKAALVNGELVMPPGMPDDILPPPDLMWGVLGVFRPEYGAELMGGDELEGGTTRLRYRYADGTELHYQTQDGILKRLELIDGGSVVQWVEIDLEENGRYPVEATYRNLAEFRELKITRDRLDRVETFPSDIWDPIGGLE